MFYLILFCLALVGVIGWQWTEMYELKRKVAELEDWSAELDPVEVIDDV